jgi:murein DD-endopeptidase MepM/ murein hydrolase activator NlpD
MRSTPRVALVAATFIGFGLAPARAATAQSSGYLCPLTGSPRIRPGDAVASSGGGFDATRSGGRRHGALDLNSTEGASVLAAHGGIAALSADGWGPFGSTVILDHGDGTYSLYAHLSGRTVHEGDSVSAGEQIGSVGYSGNAAALKTKELPPHLHFAVIQAAKSGLAGPGGPLRRMRDLDDSWESLGAEFTGPVNPEGYLPASCWSGS